MGDQPAAKRLLPLVGSARAWQPTHTLEYRSTVFTWLPLCVELLSHTKTLEKLRFTQMRWGWGWGGRGIKYSPLDRGWEPAGREEERGAGPQGPANGHGNWPPLCKLCVQHYWTLSVVEMGPTFRKPRHGRMPGLESADSAALRRLPKVRPIIELTNEQTNTKQAGVAVKL
jgi:hypothetical protein